MQVGTVKEGDVFRVETVEWTGVASLRDASALMQFQQLPSTVCACI